MQRYWFTAVVLDPLLVALAGCSTKPLAPYTEDAPALILVPAQQAGVSDSRGRFREIFCRVLEDHGAELPDYRSCEEALIRVGDEPAGSGAAVSLGQSSRGLVAVVVPGVGWDCFVDWLAPLDRWAIMYAATAMIR